MRRTLALKVLPAVGGRAADRARCYRGWPRPTRWTRTTTAAARARHGRPDSVGFNTMWVIVAGMLVMFMQAGFMFLEIGFSRQKNAGTIVAKILTNFSIAAVCWYFVGFALAFGTEPERPGRPHRRHRLPAAATTAIRSTAFPVMGISNVTVEAKFFFQFVFCAVSLAIVWGSTLERIKFGVYIIYAIVFASIIYPIGAHWVFGGGFLQAGDWLGTGIVGMQDFAGSTAVHLIGATGALAALLLLGPRKGKYGADGKPRAIPGHNMPLFGLAVLILWLGWFGFNGGTALGVQDGRFAEIIIITNLAAACGVLGALLMSRIMQKTLDIGMAGNGAIGGARRDHGAVGLRRAVGGDPDRPHRRPDRPAVRPGDRQEARRPGRRADRARHLRHLGHALLRPLHVAAAGAVQRVRRSRRRPVVLGLARPS